MKKLILVAFLLPALFAVAQKKANPTTFAKTITPEDLKKHLYIVAGKEMEGRETASPGQKKAAAYIENDFRSLGLLPGNKGDYQLKYPVYRDSLTGSTFEVNGQSFERNQDYTVSLNNYSSSLKFSEVVFVSYGIVDSSRDDYKGVDVKGKVVLTLPGAPTGTRNVGFFAKYTAAQKNGAIALITIDNNPLTASNGLGNMYLNGFKKSYGPLQFTVSPKIAQAIMGDDYKKESLSALPSKVYQSNIALAINKTGGTLESSDVLGVLEGSDLKDEYVFITAHYDHLGKRDTVIYYGADDDGSGTVSVLEIAEAFVKAKAAGHGPRRTIVFMTVSGEEKGLWGSEYYASHPVYPLEKTTVDLNIDMIGRIDPNRKQGDSTNYVYVVGDDKVSSDLKTISEATNKKYNKLELDYKFNDPNDKERIYFRSDHYNFAKNGVPIIFYFDGIHNDYHRPTDTPDKINYDLMAKRAQLVFYTAWDMANRDNMLKRDIKLEVPKGF